MSGSVAAARHPAARIEARSCYNGSVSDRPTGGPGSIFIIDANNYVFRAFHALPMLTSPDGTPINAVHGFVRMLQALRVDFSPERIVAVFDAPGPSFRDELFDEYKANRSPPPEDLRPQFPLVRAATRALGIPLLEIKGVEADDVIATLAVRARAAGMRAFILSSDKDLMQLVDDPGPDGGCIRLYDGMKRRLVGPEQVRDKYHGVGPERLGDLLALMGDSVDNVPGVPGIGPKTAAALLLEFGELEDVLTAAPSIKQKKRRERLIEHAEDARLSRILVELKRDVEVSCTLDELRDGGFDHAAVTEFFTPLGFKTTLAGLLQGGKGQSGRRGSGVAPSPSSGAAALPVVDGVTIDAANGRVLPSSKAGELEAWLREIPPEGALAITVFGSHPEPMRADIIGLALARGGGTPSALYLPVGHRNLQDDASEGWSADLLRERLGAPLADASVRKVLFNAKSQGVLLAEHGLALHGVVMDPMLASYTLDAARGSHELDALSLDVLGHALTPEERIVGKGRKQIAYDQVLVDQAGPYAVERVLCVLELGNAMAAAVARASGDEQRLFAEVELPLSEVLSALERRGVGLAPKVLEAQSEELGAALAKIRREIEEDAGYPVNPESPQQLQKLLFEDRGLPAKKKTKTGYSTDAKVLEELSLLDPIVNLILEHRSLNKLKGTYLDTLPKLVNPRTGRLHTRFRQAVAQTGRLSSSDPNLQNIPVRSARGRRIREAFVAREGGVLVALDYSQIELRVLAHLSQDKSLCAAFRDGDDVHARTAAEVFEIERADVTSEQRSVAKAVNFGVIYGQTAFGLAKTLGIPQGKAARYIKRYFERIPGVNIYMDELVERAKRAGETSTILGRRRRIPELGRRGPARAYGERIARNTPIQGSAADILKVAMIKVERALADTAWAEMVLTVHDELIFEVDAGREQELIEVVRPLMERAASMDVPLVVDAGWGRTWAETKG